MPARTIVGRTALRAVETAMLGAVSPLPLSKRAVSPVSSSNAFSQNPAAIAGASSASAVSANSMTFLAEIPFP